MTQEAEFHRERQSRHLDALAVVLEGCGLDVARRYEEPLVPPLLRVRWPDVILGDTITVAGPDTWEESSCFYRSSLGALLGSCSAPKEVAWVVARRLLPGEVARTLEEDLSACNGGM
jgi:hypothetical protein